jgi:hypothetical protein
VHDLVSKRIFAEETAGLTTRLCEGRGWQLFGVSYPVIDIGFTGSGRPGLRLRLSCDNYNELPASIELLNLDGQPISPMVNCPKSIFNSSTHPTTGKPFVCYPGSRQYHIHPSHLTDHWSNYRGLDRYKLGALLFQLWRAWQKVRP